MGRVIEYAFCPSGTWCSKTTHPSSVPLLEKQQIRPYRSIGSEHRIRQAHDGVKIAFLHQVLLEPSLDALAEKRAVGEDHGGPAAWF